MLYKVFDFADKEASDVMVPRPEVVGISVEMAPEEALRAVLESPYTRYPVFRESLDEIVGILHVRDLVSALHDSAIAEVELAALLRPAYVVPGDEGPRGPARRVPAHEPAHVGRRRRVRRDAGHRHARGPAGGDRRRDRGRVRPPRRVDRARQRDDDPDRRHLPDRRLQRGARNDDRARGLPHRRRLRLRPDRPGGRARRRGPHRRPAVHGARGRGLADPADRGRVPARRPSRPATRKARRRRPATARRRRAATRRSGTAISSSSSASCSRRGSRSRCRSSRSAGRSTRFTAIRSTSGSSGWRCSSRCRSSPCRPGTWPIASRGGRCSRSRPRSTSPSWSGCSSSPVPEPTRPGPSSCSRSAPVSPRRSARRPRGR